MRLSLTRKNRIYDLSLNQSLIVRFFRFYNFRSISFYEATFPDLLRNHSPMLRVWEYIVLRGPILRVTIKSFYDCTILPYVEIDILSLFRFGHKLLHSSASSARVRICFSLNGLLAIFFVVNHQRILTGSYTEEEAYHGVSNELCNLCHRRYVG